MNEQNLIPGAHPLTVEEASKGGRASGRARRLKSRGRKLIQEILALKYQDKEIVNKLCLEFGINPADVTNEMAMTLRQTQKAIRKGDTFAYNAVLKAAGIADETAPAGPTVGLQINVGTPQAAEGLRHALEIGAQPRQPDKPED